MGRREDAFKIALQVALQIGTLKYYRQRARAIVKIYFVSAAHAL